MAKALKDLRSMTVDELRGHENELREEVAKLQMQRYSRRLDKSSELGERKKDLARVLTVRTEKRRDEAQGAG
ncbi:MAG: 50S ribosomal protein L29 [Myxococcales bacterium]|nr:MAG: 50S ribosomal protein L29 [Myxococcales bacterium]